MKTVIGELQTEQKLLSPKQATPQVLEETALKSVRRAVSRRVGPLPLYILRIYIAHTRSGVVSLFKFLLGLFLTT
jgi:hypothetical protein